MINVHFGPSEPMSPMRILLGGDPITSEQQTRIKRLDERVDELTAKMTCYRQRMTFGICYAMVTQQFSLNQMTELMPKPTKLVDY